MSGACFAGIMDILLITVFCGAVSAGLHWQLSQLVIQFLFPPLCDSLYLLWHTVQQTLGFPLSLQYRIICCILGR